MNADVQAAIKAHFSKDARSITPLTGGYSFNTYLVVLQDGQKIVFRTAHDYETSGGRKIIMSDIFEREKFFYENINNKIGHICPEVYVIDDTFKHYDKPFQISQYIEGTPLNLCYSSFGEQERRNIDMKIGETCAKINSIEIDCTHNYVSDRTSWEDFISTRIVERLTPLKNQVITIQEIEQIRERILSQRADNDFRFLHLDMRHINIIYNNGEIFVLDAENCEFGDPLFEVASADTGGSYNNDFLIGYESTIGKHLDLDKYLYFCYKMERTALVLDLFMNEIKSDKQTIEHYLGIFNQLKAQLLN